VTAAAYDINPDASGLGTVCCSRLQSLNLEQLLAAALGIEDTRLEEPTENLAHKGLAILDSDISAICHALEGTDIPLAVQNALWHARCRMLICSELARRDHLALIEAQREADALTNKLTALELDLSTLKATGGAQ
jgi:hypothetical protein